VLPIQLLEPRYGSLLDFEKAESAVAVSIPLFKKSIDVRPLSLHLPYQRNCADYNEKDEPDQ
jgi:hypothetical protein